MLITITNLSGITGQELRQWRNASHALCLKDRMILSMSQAGACQALNTPGAPAREPTLDELKQWFAGRQKHGRSNQRFVEGGLPYLADD